MPVKHTACDSTALSATWWWSQWSKHVVALTSEEEEKNCCVRRTHNCFVNYIYLFIHLFILQLIAINATWDARSKQENRVKCNATSLNIPKEEIYYFHNKKICTLYEHLYLWFHFNQKLKYRMFTATVLVYIGPRIVLHVRRTQSIFFSVVKRATSLFLDTCIQLEN
jgi:hypothetical protein